MSPASVFVPLAAVLGVVALAALNVTRKEGITGLRRASPTLVGLALVGTLVSIAASAFVSGSLRVAAIEAISVAAILTIAQQSRSRWHDLSVGGRAARVGLVALFAWVALIALLLALIGQI